MKVFAIEENAEVRYGALAITRLGATVPEASPLILRWYLGRRVGGTNSLAKV